LKSFHDSRPTQISLRDTDSITADMILAEFACPINAATHLAPIVRVIESSL
jgi:hypothetical protein